MGQSPHTDAEDAALKLALQAEISYSEYNGLKLFQNMLSPYRDERLVIDVQEVMTKHPQWIESLRAGFDFLSRITFLYESNARVIKRHREGKYRRRIMPEEIMRAQQHRRDGRSYRDIQEMMGWSYSSTVKYCQEVTPGPSSKPSVGRRKGHQRT